MIYIFWVCIIVLLFAYFGYPFYVYIRSRFFKNPVLKNLKFAPFVSVVMSVYNEEAYIERKINNLLQSIYPKDRLEILVGSDGSRDGTNAILLRMSNDQVRAFIFPKRRGKASVLNDIVPKARGEILIFCDARQAFDKDAVSQLAANFADEKVGCASGELVFDKAFSINGVSEGVGLYWDYEKFIRKSESAIHSMVGATGAIYAIRKKLYKEPHADAILDDVYIPLAIVRQGYRSIWDSEAKAYDKPAFTPQEEYMRKVRTLAGNYQIFAMFKDLFNPFRSAVSIPLVSHKLLRALAPFFLISMFVSNLFIAKKDFYGAFFICQIIFYILAFMGSAAYNKKSKKTLVRIASTAYMFCLLNFTALVGFYRFVFRKQEIAWER